MRAVLARTHAVTSCTVKPTIQLTNIKTIITQSPTYLYALPVWPNGAPVKGPDEWDDYSLWVGAFSARGNGRWAATGERVVTEYGLEFRRAGPAGRVLRRFDEPTRSAFHNKIRLFTRLTAARVDCVPPTVFSPSDARDAMAACAQSTVWFYKKAKASRGRGVYPITSVDQLPPKELAEAEAAVAAAASMAASTASTATHIGPSSATSAAITTPSGTAATAGANPGCLGASDTGGIFQQQVPRMLLTKDGHKFDLRVLVVMGPGRRAWLHRTLYLRVATAPFASGSDLSRHAQCTNISQGGAVHAVRGGGEGSTSTAEADILPPRAYDVVLRNICDATRSVVSASCDFLPAPSPPLADATQAVEAAAGQQSDADAAAARTSSQGDCRTDAVHYFGFDYMLDEHLKPWLLEVNSTPRLINCDRASFADSKSGSGIGSGAVQGTADTAVQHNVHVGESGSHGGAGHEADSHDSVAAGGGPVHEALCELLYGIIEPCLEGRPVRDAETGGWVQVFP